jgi:hypothetical protein
VDESKLAADLRVELRDRTEQLAKAEATIERVRAENERLSGILRALGYGEEA